MYIKNEIGKVNISESYVLNNKNTLSRFSNINTSLNINNIKIENDIASIQVDEYMCDKIITYTLLNVYTTTNIIEYNSHIHDEIIKYKLNDTNINYLFDNFEIIFNRIVNRFDVLKEINIVVKSIDISNDDEQSERKLDIKLDFNFVE